MKNKTSFSGYFFAVFIIILVSATPAYAQTTDSVSTLSPEAREAFNRGISSAKKHDYLSAIRDFRDARKTQDWRSRSTTEPDAPMIYLNLGLAESKIPGRELRAICWYETYLTAYPHAPNAAAVKDQVELLDSKSQTNISRFIQFVQDAAAKIKPDKEKIVGMDHYPTYDGDNAMVQVSALWARIGDFSAANRAIGLIQSANDWLGIKKGAEKSLADAQAKFAANKMNKAYYYGDITSFYQWMRLVDEGHNFNNDGLLNKPVFLDLNGYLKSLPSYDSPQKYFDALTTIAWDLVHGQEDIDNMLKKLAGQ